MTTIDKLDIGIYVQYALRTQMLEEINQQYRLSEAKTIPAQLQLLDLYPKPSELDLLLGVIPVTTPWAYFSAPKNFNRQRRSPFTFSRIVPSIHLFDFDEKEEKESDEEKLQKTVCESDEEEAEKKVLLKCLSQVKKMNSWLSFIVGRVGQFLQG